MIYAYKRGDGNEGNFFRANVIISESDCPYAALRALVPNDYIAGKRVRRHIIRTIEIDGEAEYGVLAVVYEGPDGEMAYDAAYLTAELVPDSGYEAAAYPLRDLLDPAAWRQYRKELKGAVT